VTWVVLVPLKRLADAKTRLLLPGAARRRLALAMAADVAAVAAGAGEVRLVSADPEAGLLGVPVVDDVGGGLSLAVLAAAAAVPGPVAVLAADLPAARAADLVAALDAAAGSARAVLADTPGTGTVLLTAAAGRLLAPSYGEGSAARHRARGAVDLAGGLPPVPGLRRDVDTLADLAAATALGLGPATSAVVTAGHARSPGPEMMQR